MKCPIDQTDLVMSERQGVEIDYCPTCRGVWLDRGELDKIIDRANEQTAAESAGPRSPRDSFQTRTVAGMSGTAQPMDTRDRYDDRDRDRYDDDDQHSGGRKKKKRGSFLEDLFDFG